MSHPLLQLTADLIDIESVTFEESTIADWIEGELRGIDDLHVVRLGDNVVARTNLDRPHRVALAAHLDTGPVNDNGTARIEDEVVFGLGASDAKGNIAIMLELARNVTDPAVDVNYIFYAREKAPLDQNGLLQLFEEATDLLQADSAILGKPTDAVVEAGCQGTMSARVTLRGKRAHSARPWLGTNAVHRLASLLSALDTLATRKPVIDGCEFREATQAVFVEGGVAGNVVPDEATVTINHRFAPDRSSEEAEEFLRRVCGVHMLDDDSFELIDVSSAAKPDLRHPLMAIFLGRNDLLVRAKFGWTDVALFAEQGIPAVNFGPGDPTLAHAKGENLNQVPLVMAYQALEDLLSNGV